MSLFKNLKGLFQNNKQPEITKVDAKTDGQGVTVKKPDRDVPQVLSKEKPSGGTVVWQEKTPQLTTLEMAEEGGWACKAATVYCTGDLIANRYKVEGVLSGAMGYVYICKDTSQRIMFAIKQPKSEMLADRELFSRVLLEADAWTKLGMHPNIAYCYFVRVIEEVPYIFIEYVDGGSLEDWISDRRCADYKIGIDMAIQFCHGLERAHDRGMIHRDIKPRNVLVTKNGEVKVTDFGLVGGGKAGGKASTISGDQHGTRIGDMMGTPAYMPPEQWNDPRQKSVEAPEGVWYESDVFSFGICMWEMFCGRRPYEVSIGVKGGPPDPRDLKKDIPDELRYLLLKSVELDRYKRQADFRQLKEELNGVYQNLYGIDSPHYKLELHDTTADELNNQGYSYLELGKKDEARKCFEAAMKANNTHPEAVFNLALIQWRDGETDDLEALKTIRSCLSNPAVSKEKIAEFLAYAHAERFDLDSAKEELSQYPGRFDDLFGGRKIAQAGLVRTFKGHGRWVTSVSLSADGRYVLSGSGDQTLKLWEVATGACLRTFEGHGDIVISVSLSADSRYAISGSKDMTLKLWEVETGVCLRTFEGHRHWVESVYLSADGRHVLSGSGDQTLKLWEIETGACLRTFEGHGAVVCSVSLSADGRYAISGSWDDTLKFWEVETGACLRTFKGHGKWVTSVNLSADNKYVLSGSRDQTLKLWEVETGKCLHTFEGHSEILSAGLSADSSYAISGNSDKTLKLWEVATGKCLRTFEGHSDLIHSATLSADGRYILSGSKDQTLKLWERGFDNRYLAQFQITDFKGFQEIKGTQDDLLSSITEAEQVINDRNYTKAFSILYSAWEQAGFIENRDVLRVYQELYSRASIKTFSFCYLEKTFGDHSGWVKSVSLSPDGRYALSGTLEKTLKLWEVGTGQLLRNFEGHRDQVHAVSLSTDSRYAISGCEMTLRLWDIHTGNCLRTFKGHSGSVSSVSLSADTRYALSGSADRTLKLWEVGTGECLFTFKGHRKEVTSVSLSADGGYALSGSRDKMLKLWEVQTGMCLRTFEGHGDDVLSVSLNADGRYALSGSGDKTLKLWNAETGKCLRTFEGHSGIIHSVILTGDSRYVLSGSSDKTIKVWDVETGKCLHTSEGNRESVSSVSLSADGGYALSGSGDKALKLWRLIWKLEFDENK